MGCCLGTNPYINPDHVDITHFKLERVIGQGGFGKVQAAIKRSGPDADKWYAVKVLSKTFVLSTSSGADSVFTELKALTELSNFFICNSHYAFQDERFLYLVLDLALGGDLRYNLRHSPRTRFTEERARFYIAQVLLALDYLHKHNYLHRDIKPDNVLLVSTGYIKLTDMGVSKKLDDIENCRSASGTHGYMAPEIYLDGHKHGTAAEWFSLGVCLHEFLLGRRPYDQKKIMNAAKLEHSVAKEMFPLKYLKNALQISSEAKDLCGSMLEFDPSSRWGKRKGGGLEEYKKHPWFKDFPWGPVSKRQHPAPFKPDVTKANFDTSIADVEEILNKPESPPPVKPDDQSRFAGYQHNVSFDAEEEARRVEKVKTRKDSNKKRFSIKGGIAPLPTPTADN